jgi:VIT1/CCC1 family predicted Fe2+/Mn2+ transporter
VAGFSGAALSNETTTQLSFMVVLLFGLANLFADGVSMGLGNFLSVRAEQSQYRIARCKEEVESKQNGDAEEAETVTILVSKGFSEVDARTLAVIYRKNPSYWLDFMMSHELEMPDSRNENAFYNGFATFASFTFFGIIPLLPFIFMGSFDPQTVFWYSAGGAFIALLLLGILKWKIIGSSHPVRTILEVVIVGSVAASVAFFVGTLFEV